MTSPENRGGAAYAAAAKNENGADRQRHDQRNTLKNMKEQFDILELAACSDIRPERSKARAEEFGVRCMTNEEILADPSIEMVVNTTYPTAHFEVSKAALEAGKNVYCEKMTTLSVEQSTELMELAASKGLFVGGAPDTFLAGGMQLARQLLDSGIVGTPVAAEVTLCRLSS